MRFIYIDEAGTSANEPVTVVTGVIVHADRDWMRSDQRLKEILSAVPEKHRSETLSAKAIWGDPKLREGWAVEDRMNVLHSLMALPREMKMPLAVGAVRRDPNRFAKFGPAGVAMMDGMKITAAQFEHCVAFGECLTSADHYVRDFADPGEVATVVVEDIPEMARFLKTTIPLFKKKTLKFATESSIPSPEQIATGVESIATERKITRIVDSVHFTDKANGPLLKIADACAFGFRRFFSGQKMGTDFAQSIMGGPLTAYQGKSVFGAAFRWV